MRFGGRLVRRRLIIAEAQQTLFIDREVAVHERGQFVQRPVLRLFVEGHADLDAEAVRAVGVREPVERVATYFVTLLNSLAMESSSPPSAFGQCAAKIS